MVIIKGTLSGRNRYRTEGNFTFSQQSNGNILFETSDDFFFGNAQGGGTPAPGFALCNGNVDALTKEELERIARQTDFFRIANSPVSVSGKQMQLLPRGLDLIAFDTLFLWCFEVPFLLGVSLFEPVAPLRS
ncbi:MAG: hypothetical protein JJ894_05920 [Dinoroseobacter sp.]|nr:hypothetical protein [Dinoroseobacter sp.]